MEKKGIEYQIIEIPAGTKFIEASNIPQWIAESLVSMPDTPPLMVELKKKTPIKVKDLSEAEAQPLRAKLALMLNGERGKKLSKGDAQRLPEVFDLMLDGGDVSGPDVQLMKNHMPEFLNIVRSENLSEEDVQSLAGIWGHFPTTPTPEQFAMYRKAFEKAPNRPDWQLVPLFRDLRNEAKGERIKIALLHRKNINAAIQNGSLRVLTKDRDVARQLDWGALISTADARAYLEPLGFELREKQSLGQVVPLPIESSLSRGSEGKLDEQHPKPESTRKTENLLRALTAIAIDAYGYDPESSKSTAPKDIADALEKREYSIDQKTIRNWLKEGSALLPHRPNKV